MNIIADTGLQLWTIFGEMAPYLLLGFLVAGVLSVFVSAEWVERHLGGRGLWPVIKASLLGVPLPLCSCGVIPVAASLRRHGSSKGATAAFLLSTPQTGVDSILVTYGLLGPVIAIFRPVAAFVSGLLGGWLVEKFDTPDTAPAQPEACHDECCAPSVKRSKWIQALHYGFVTLPLDIAKPLLIGLGIAALISALIPADFFSRQVDNAFLQMLIMMALGIPIYVCATGSVPIAAAMILKGISPGAALVFLMTGPATNAAALAVIWKTLGRRTALMYLMAVALTALASGLILNALFAAIQVNPVHMGHSMLPPLVNHVSAVILLGVLGIPLLHSARRAHTSTPPVAGGVTMEIKGMTCSHCVELIRRTLASMPGVQSVEVGLDSGKVQVNGSIPDVHLLVQAVDRLGYHVVQAKAHPAGSH